MPDRELDGALRKLWSAWEGNPREFAATLSAYVAKAKRAAAMLEPSDDVEGFESAYREMETTGA